jgi:hypothetical protein
MLIKKEKNIILFANIVTQKNIKEYFKFLSLIIDVASKLAIPNGIVHIICIKHKSI